MGVRARRTTLSALLALGALAGCTGPTPPYPTGTPSPSTDAPPRRRIDAILAEHRVTTAAVGLLRGGTLVFEHYYLWRAMERKHGATFPALVERYLFGPLGIETARLTVDRADRENVALAVDDDGKRYDPGCRPGFCWPEGEWSAAGGMLITLRDYAKVMSAVSGGAGYGAALVSERDRIATERGAESVVDCAYAPTACPRAQGFGLGFVELDLGARRTIGHEGGDWFQLTIGTSDLASRDGLIIFLNVPMERGIAPMRDLVALLDPSSPYVARFAKWADEQGGNRPAGSGVSHPGAGAIQSRNR